MGSELRPLVCAGGYPADGGITFVLSGRDVHVDGDLDFIGAVLARCDGATPVEEIAAAVAADPADVEDLVGTLREHGVVLDCAEVWRRFDEQSSVHGFYKPVSSEELSEVLRTRSRPAGEPVGRVPLEPRPTKLGELTGARRSALAEDPDHDVSFAELSTILTAMYADPEGAHRPVPSGGGIYPLLVHVYLRRECGPLDPGVWWFDARAEALAHLTAEPPDTYELFLPDNTCAGLLAQNRPVLFVSADVARSARKYSNRAYRFALIETGAVTQNAYLAAAELGVPIRAAAGFDERAAHERLRLDDGSVALLSLLLGA